MERKWKITIAQARLRDYIVSAEDEEAAMDMALEQAIADGENSILADGVDVLDTYVYDSHPADEEDVAG